MNFNFKGNLAKFWQETNLAWPDLLPLALLHDLCMPVALGFSPFELVHGKPPPCLGNLPGNLHQVGNKEIKERLQALGATLNKLQKYTIERVPIP